MQFIVNQMTTQPAPPPQATKDEQIKALYEAGATWAEIREQVYVDGAAISKSLSRSGVALRGPRILAPDDRIKALYESGKTWAEIAKEVGVAAGTVGKSLARSGVKLRGRKRTSK